MSDTVIWYVPVVGALNLRYMVWPDDVCDSTFVIPVPTAGADLHFLDAVTVFPNAMQEQKEKIKVMVKIRVSVKRFVLHII